jgi:hypothetical protein
MTRNHRDRVAVWKRFQAVTEAYRALEDAAELACHPLDVHIDDRNDFDAVMIALTSLDEATTRLGIRMKDLVFKPRPPCRKPNLARIRT